MNNIAEYCFFCLPAEVDIDDYSERLQWGYQHPEAPTVLSLNQEQVDFYHELGLWNIMSDYMIGPSDSNVIFDIEIEKIRDAVIEEFILKDNNINKMIEILNYAIFHRKAVVINLG